MALIGCSDDNSGYRSKTPRITVDEAASNSSASLLDQQAVRSISAMSDVVAQDIADVPIFENPDPRGPCGAVVAQLPFDGAAGRAFSNSTISAFQLVVQSGPSQHEYLDALLADRVEGCQPYESTTNQGMTQTVSDIEFLETTDLADRSIAWFSRVSVGGATIYGGAGFVEGPAQTTLVQVQSRDPISSSVLRELVALAAQQVT